MEYMEGWIVVNWFNILSAIGIVGSLLLTTISLRSETKTRRIGNLLTLTENHREIWSVLFEHPSLGRVLEASADLSKRPITLNESFYVNMIIQHVSSAYQAMRSGLVIQPEGLRQDICSFFSLPIPKAIWEKLKFMQKADFVKFVDSSLAQEGKRY